MTQERNTKPIATARVGDDATVHVLSIQNDVDLTCSRDCSMLQTSDDGTLKCLFDWVKGLADFKTKALVVDYEVVLDTDAAEEWSVSEGCFLVIDSDGHINKGRVLCEKMTSPLNIGVKETPHNLFPGTRATFQIYYNSFPSGATISSIIVEKSRNVKARIFLDPKGLSVKKSEIISDRPVFDPSHNGDLFDRMKRLEETVRALQKQISQLWDSKSESVHPVDDINADTPSEPETESENKITIKTVSELLNLDPTGFRDVVIQLLHGQGFKNITPVSDPEVGFGSMTGSRFGTLYAIFAVQENKSNYSTDLRKIQWLEGFRKRHNAEKAVYVTSGKLSRDAEREAVSSGIEVLDIDRISIMLALKDDSFGYHPLKK